MLSKEFNTYSLQFLQKFDVSVTTTMVWHAQLFFKRKHLRSMDIPIVQCGFYFNPNRSFRNFRLTTHKFIITWEPKPIQRRNQQQALQHKTCSNLVRIPSFLLILPLHTNIPIIVIDNKQPRVHLRHGGIRHVHFCTVCSYLQYQSAHIQFQIFTWTCRFCFCWSSYVLGLYGHCWQYLCWQLNYESDFHANYVAWVLDCFDH